MQYYMLGLPIFAPSIEFLTSRRSEKFGFGYPEHFLPFPVRTRQTCSLASNRPGRLPTDRTHSSTNIAGHEQGWRGGADSPCEHSSGTEHIQLEIHSRIAVGLLALASYSFVRHSASPRGLIEGSATSDNESADALSCTHGSRKEQG